MRKKNNRGIGSYKRPRQEYIKQFKLTALFKKEKLPKKKYEGQEQTTTTELQAPYFGQITKIYVVLNMFLSAEPSLT